MAASSFTAAQGQLTSAVNRCHTAGSRGRRRPDSRTRCARQASPLSWCIPRVRRPDAIRYAVNRAQDAPGEPAAYSGRPAG